MAHCSWSMKSLPKYLVIPRGTHRPEFQAFTHPEDLAKSVGKVGRPDFGEIPNCTVEKRYLRPDGTQPWAQLTNAAMVRDESGEGKYIIVQWWKTLRNAAVLQRRYAHRKARRNGTPGRKHCA